MRTGLSASSALLATCAIGAAAKTVVHAQVTPPAYSIVEVDVIDAEGLHVRVGGRRADVVAYRGQLGHRVLDRGRTAAGATGSAPQAKTFARGRRTDPHQHDRGRIAKRRPHQRTDISQGAIDHAAN